MLAHQDVVLAIKLTLNREPKGDEEISRLAKSGSLKALRIALLEILQRESPVLGESDLYKTYRAPLFLLSPPMHDIPWRLSPPNLTDPVTQLCTYGQVISDEYANICAELQVKPRPHRKQWEFVWIIATLRKAGMLSPGRRLLGFGCGQEMLPAYFASHGAVVLATDAPPEIVAPGWTKTKQYSESIDPLFKPGLIKRDIFDQLVSFRHADMNNLPDDVPSFDACWSACALEHLGSLRHGMDFIRNSLKCLNAGGIAVHTTEFNLSSNEETFENSRLSIYRMKDIVLLLNELREEGHEVWPLNLHPGDQMLDEVIDLPPRSPIHLKLLLKNKFVTTSIGIVVRKKVN
jgi:2-polyprenyl-3-methyl-5-hydroxy-6-metoxy-1,4-benzoquinol methylase